MSEYKNKPAWYDYPLYMRIFPLLKNDKNLYKRDAFEDYLTLYSVFVLYGAVRPNSSIYSGYYW